MNKVLLVTRDQVAISVDQLQQLSGGVRESVVLWLAGRTDNNCVVQTVFIPPQQAAVDYFTIPREGMREVLAQCRCNGIFVAAQLHTHPFDAFHSEADDEFALIRHKNGLSFVFANFAANVPPANFSSHATLFRLSEHNRWEFVPETEHFRYYRIQ